LVKLSEALEAQIAGIVHIRWTQLAGGTMSATRHWDGQALREKENRKMGTS
jgi:hypothetical protein